MRLMSICHRLKDSNAKWKGEIFSAYLTLSFCVHIAIKLETELKIFEESYLISYLS